MHRGAHRSLSRAGHVACASSVPLVPRPRFGAHRWRSVAGHGRGYVLREVRWQVSTFREFLEIIEAHPGATFATVVIAIVLLTVTRELVEVLR